MYVALFYSLAVLLVAVALSATAVVFLLRLHRRLIFDQFREHQARQALEELETEAATDSSEEHRLRLVQAREELHQAISKLEQRARRFPAGLVLRWMQVDDGTQAS